MSDEVMILRYFNFLTRNGQGSVFFVQLVFFGGEIVDVDATEVRTSGCIQGNKTIKTFKVSSQV
jgi:hypothetical protein